MGLLVEGKWRDQWYDTAASGGRFERSAAAFRNWVTPDGSAGPSGSAGFAAAAGRYHLYVSLACPWAHRTLIFRRLKQLESVISVSVVHPDMLEQGWAFAACDAGPYDHGDPVLHKQHLHEIYTAALPDYSGRVTVPVLWDKQQGTIVSNESSELIRMFNSSFDALTDNRDDYYPPPLRRAIDSINETVYHTVNNGVYRCGFATAQEAYEEAFDALFATLDALEARLAEQPYLVGATLTEADWRLFTTLVRFDAVYHGHFKANRQRIADLPHLQAYMLRLYRLPGIAETVHMQQIKRHYYYSHATINPTRVVPKGPRLDWLA